MIAEVEAKLKDCPFCGAAGEMRTNNATYTKWYWGKCSNPDCRVSTQSFRDPAEAQKVWNTRNRHELAL